MFGGWVIKCSKFCSQFHTAIKKLNCVIHSKFLKCPERFQIWAVEMAKKVKAFVSSAARARSPEPT